jgi:hypothetical protein
MVHQDVEMEMVDAQLKTTQTNIQPRYNQDPKYSLYSQSQSHTNLSWILSLQVKRLCLSRNEKVAFA